MQKKIKWYQKCLSYIYDVPLEAYETELNEDLQLHVRQGQLLLSTPNAIYSYGKNYLNFSEAIGKIDPNQLSEKKILILGLGMGSIPVIIEKRHKKINHYTAIEKDAEIIKMCSDYVLPNLNSQFEILEGDAYPIVMNLDRRFDIIAMDIFVDDFTPEEFKTIEYLQRLKELLKPEGILLYNVLYSTEKDQMAANDFICDRFGEVFPEHGLLEIKGNIILTNKTL